MSVGQFNVGAIGPEPAGATPIDDEDLAGLIPTFVATRADLNQVEYENIARALPWATRRCSGWAACRTIGNPVPLRAPQADVQ